MDDKELAEHISRMLYFGNERNIELSLSQLYDILKQTEAPDDQLCYVGRAMGATRELAEMAVLKFGEVITKKHIDRLLARVYERRRGGED